MTDKTIRSVIGIFVCILLAGCVTAVDETLPYAQLPEITVATQFNLVASPSHPTAYLSTDPISAGERVQVIGTDKDAKWLLVLHDNRLGWMPTIYSRTNIGRDKSAFLFEPLSDKCTKYLGATFAPDEAWVSNASGAALVVGSIYRPQAGTPFEEAALALEIDGSGTAIASDYLHTSLTASSALVLFAYSLSDLQKGSQISFNLTNSGNEPLSFEAIFFSNDCSDNLNQLPIGKKKTLVTEPASVQADDNRQPETAKGPVIIRPSAQSSDTQQGSDCIQPPDGLVSWWPGDGNADDIVGVNNGKLMGGVEFTDGMVGQAFRFDGSNDIVMATATGLPRGAAPRTVAFWAKTDPSVNNATGFGYGNEAGGQGFYIFPAHSEAGGRLTFSSHGYSDFRASYNNLKEYNLKDGQYHHIAVTYDRSIATVYIDGVAVVSGNLSLNTGTSGGACIGGRCYLGEFFIGEVDEVAVWNRDLSTSEIEVMFNGGSSGMCKPEATASALFLGLIPFGAPNSPDILNPVLGWQPGISKASTYDLTMHPGFLTLIAGPGTNQAPWEGKDTAPLVTYSYTGNFRSQVKVIFSPEGKVHKLAGLGVRSAQNHENWLRITRTMDSFSGQSVSILGGKNIRLNYASYVDDEVFLRIERQGPLFTLSYSTNGVNWINLQKDYVFEMSNDVEIFLTVFSTSDEGAVAQFSDFEVVAR